MSIKDTLNNDLKQAMLAKDNARRDTLRLLLAAVKQVEVDSRKELNDSDLQDILTREAKRRRESIAGFEQGGRADLVAKEQAELAIIENYLPKQLGRDEIVVLAKQAIAASGATSEKQMGAIMQKLMPMVKGKADGKLVNQIVKELLTPS